MNAIKKIAAVVLSAAIMMGSSAVAFAANPSKTVSKDESVYLLLNADGSVKEQTVSCWLHADDGLCDVADISTLDGITNIKSSVAPEISGSTVRWNTTDTDIYYTGRCETLPPVSVAITYTLNNEPICAQELMGKSGEVSISIKLNNNEKQIKLIEGKNLAIYTPFAVAVVMDFPVKTFKNLDAGDKKILSE